MTIFPRLAAAIAFCFSVSGYTDPLTVSTWGGIHGDVVSAEILRPFSANFDIPVEHTVEVQSDALRKVPGIVELSHSEAVDACEKSEILLLPIDRLGDNSRYQNVIVDFVPNTLQPCAIGHSVWSTVVAFDNKRYGFDETPHLINDFFDVEFYPGKRIVRRSPRVLVEWALVASGIAPSSVYTALDNADTSWALISQKLKLIEDHIIWVESDAEAIEHVRAGSAAFAMLSSDSLVRDLMHGSDQLGVLWDAAVTELSLWAIPSDAANPERAWEFIRYATSVNNSGKVASVFGYGPVRYSTLQLIDRGYQKMLPTWPDNQHNLLWGNSMWWQDNGGAITERFTQWVQKLEDKADLTLAAISKELSIIKVATTYRARLNSDKTLRLLTAIPNALGRPLN